MKKLFFSLTLMAACSARGQGTFQYDQQLSDLTPSGAYVHFQAIADPPTGQSFVPSLSAVGFVQLYLRESTFNNGVGATVSVNLWADSLTEGTLLGSSMPVFLPDNFVGVTDFLFATAIQVIPGTTYYLQPVVQSGETSWYAAFDSSFFYTKGSAFFQGLPRPDAALWFREGIVVPEPSAAEFILLGFVGVHFLRRLNAQP